MVASMVSEIQGLVQLLEILRRRKRIKAKLFEAITCIKQLRDNVLVKVRNQKYLLGLDKRKLIPRSEHSSLNLLIQSCGALIIKMATVILTQKIKGKKL